jgi:hypothetical protein
VLAIRWLSAALATACLIVPAPDAGGHDDLAPPGAAHDWLPDEDWIARHWVPFDERTLTARLGIPSRDLEAYLYDDHHPLADLARARGLDIAALRDELVAPWRSTVDVTRYTLLRERTERVLTQPHLAQHVFFHLFHGSAVAHDPQGTFGLPADTVRQLRLGGLTPAEIAQRGGVSEAALRASILHFLHLEHDEGILDRSRGPPSRTGSSSARPPGSTAGWTVRERATIRPIHTARRDSGTARIRADGRGSVGSAGETSGASSDSGDHCGVAAGRSRPPGAGGRIV